MSGMYPPSPPCIQFGGWLPPRCSVRVVNSALNDRYQPPLLRFVKEVRTSCLRAMKFSINLGKTLLSRSLGAGEMIRLRVGNLAVANSVVLPLTLEGIISPAIYHCTGWIDLYFYSVVCEQSRFFLFRLFYSAMLQKWTLIKGCLLKFALSGSLPDFTLIEKDEGEIRKESLAS